MVDEGLVKVFKGWEVFLQDLPNRDESGTGPLGNRQLKLEIFVQNLLGLILQRLQRLDHLRILTQLRHTQRH